MENLLFRQADEALQKETSSWDRGVPLEDVTCRAVVKGKRVANERPNESWVLLCSERNMAVAKITVFDFNSRSRCAEFGYQVHKDFRGMGLSKILLAEMFDHYFNEPVFFAGTSMECSMNKLYCQTAEFNAPSIRLVKSMGMRLDGVLREHHEKDGILMDDHVYSILKREWNGSEQALKK
jgi:RimJ/RimL family protein N-acetyltransferase